MPPKASKPAPETPDDVEAKKRRKAAQHTLLESSAPISFSRVPAPLSKSDGADIVKRNASRKKKYLFIFPGTLSLPPGAKIGELKGLDTRAPVLLIEVGRGRLLLKGCLVFPRNAFIALKGGRAKGKPLHVVGNFETLVVFSEWAWVGNDASNPLMLPQPLPGAVTASSQTPTPLWRTSADHCAEPLTPDGEKPSAGDDLNIATPSSCDLDGEGREWRVDVPIPVGSTRSNPSRRARVADYSALAASNSSEDCALSDEPNRQQAEPPTSKLSLSSDDDLDMSEARPNVDKSARKNVTKRKRVLEHESSSNNELDVPGARPNADTSVRKKATKRKRSLELEKQEQIIDVDQVSEVVNLDVEEKAMDTGTSAVRTSTRKRRVVKYSQESGDEYEDPEDADDYLDEEDFVPNE